MKNISAPRILLSSGLGTALSLLGDSSMYTVLPTHYMDAGVVFASVGILLSANRWIRLPLNGPAGLFIERIPRRWMFIPALFLGALSTAIYGLVEGYVPLLVARILWGIAWVGIWVGGNTIVLDASNERNRGKWVGAYQVSFFLGGAAGAILGGVLTDWIGFQPAMLVNAGLQSVGALFAFLFLPETKGMGNKLLGKPIPVAQQTVIPEKKSGTVTGRQTRKGELASAIGLLAVNRIVVPGFMVTTLGRFLENNWGSSILIGGRSIGVATLTGLALGMTTIISMASAPTAGRRSDQTQNRWGVAALGLVPGILGFALITFGETISVIGGLMLVAVASGSNTNLSTALIGDLAPEGQHGRRLGTLFTIGDLASAIGPPLAFWLIPFINISGVYWLAAGFLTVMLSIAAGYAYRGVIAARPIS